jgi:hypothetical protein
MTIPARTWQGATITLDALEQYERTYMGSDGYVYIETDDSLGNLEFGSGFWDPPHTAMEEHRVHQYDLNRLKRDTSDSTELVIDPGEGCVFYEPSVNGNVMSSIYDSPGKAVDALMLKALPVGSRIYLTADRLADITEQNELALATTEETDGAIANGYFLLDQWRTISLELYSDRGAD